MSSVYRSRRATHRQSIFRGQCNGIRCQEIRRKKREKDPLDPRGTFGG